MTLNIVILAAGQGKRMYSDVPKVLHFLAGQPLLEHVVHTAEKLSAENQPLVICGHQSERVRHTLANLNVTWVMQAEQRGTGHAVQQALSHLPQTGQVLILYGDVPLITIETLKQLIAATNKNSLGIITAELPDPTGFGRIIRNKQGDITAIVEEKDATSEQRIIQEINTGIYLVPAEKLHAWLPQLKNSNAQQEFYLTDIVPMAVAEKTPITRIQPQHYEEILGVNNRLQLACLERFYQQQAAEKLMLQGVTLRDPHRFDVRGEITIGHDVIIDVNVILEGHVTIGSGCIIGANSTLRNVVIGNNTEIKPNSLIDGAEIAENCFIGPFARIRPGTVLHAETHIGNFVEIKNSRVGTASKINHLSYVGDAEIGKRVNIGAGTITCNYDGVNKHKTIIGDAVFVGSNTELVAPLTLGEGATIGAGSTITRNAPANQLTLSRAEQRSISNWQRPKKKEKET